MLGSWQDVRFVVPTLPTKHARLGCVWFAGRSPRVQREYHGVPCASNRVLPHKSCYDDAASPRCFTMVRRKTTEAGCRPTFGCETVMSMSSGERLLIIIPS